MLPYRSKVDDDFRELLDELLEDCERTEDLPSNDGLMKELKIKLMASATLTPFCHF